MDKLLSLLQVRILPQEEVSCLRSDGVRVEGDRNTGATPDKRDPRPRPWVRAIVQPVTQVNLVSLVNVSHAVMLGEHGVAPQFHHWLTSAEFEQRFGPRDADVNAVAAWLRAEGFTINSINRAQH